ncbi:MAG: excinuclease ABC subunit UvrC [Acidibrevibacterium sp.]|uniref:excinuclease ABC subunit UvrC n=1 Tax=Acidibrevibacterium fodinaquatile TaxID=1969806 RepID=UPI0023A7EAC7|nr:excinuclease ABC subunit UvrC [Acidibrevibacterium fodinaquatile]MCA7118409.1 excinuclease ABC subunit UvrC [Acidibrevibacterium fodinaquatile]
MPEPPPPSLPLTQAPGPGGAAVIAAAIATLPEAPGVYRMLDGRGNALYIGKARSLKKRVPAYLQPARLPERLRRMVSETVSLEIIVTHSEAEALLLEATLIKRLKPRYNIVLRDDKSYPWLLLTEDHPFPQITKHRGAQTRRGSYWGPFASAWSVDQTLTELQRVFLLRSCADTVFAHRARPCLLYQIKRCSAPCVGRISAEDYAALVEQAKAFLGGAGLQIQRQLAAEMEAASAALDFERAAMLRDRIRGLTQVQGHGAINPEALGDADVIGAWQTAGQTAIQVFFIRGGHNNGNRAFFPNHAQNEAIGAVLAAFIAQFYDDKPPPPQILLSDAVPEPALIAEALSLKAGRKVALALPQRGEKRAILDLARMNAREALERRLAEAAGQAALLTALAETFALPAPPSRIEVFDNSHIMGTSPYGVMIVAGPAGFEKAAYRKFAIRGPITPGDDFAMLREMLARRFARLAAADAESAPRPDLLLIDGGAGQLSSALAVLAEFGLGDLPVIAIAKGPDRDAGREWFHQAGQPPRQLPPRDPVLYYLQRLRDEAHRFAITTHRAGRGKRLIQSELDEISGIGAARKRALLHHFGSVRGVKQAGLADLEAAPGINRATARRLYAHFNPGARLADIPPPRRKG